MRYRRLDADGDMLPATPLNPPYVDAEAVGAAIRSRLLSFQGEWWEDEDEGIPIEALTGHLDEEDRVVAEALIQERIAETEGVNDVIETIITDDSAGRIRHVEATVETIYGDIELEV